ncbi:retrovirus-related pol polyprotein from transposon TNT 1-94 [Tanacetum coccineum]
MICGNNFWEMVIIQIGNVMISRVYYVEGLGHNLFSVGQFCDSNLEVAFRQHTCFIRNLEGVDLLTGSRGNNLYTLSLGDMMASSPISRHGLVRGLPKALNLKWSSSVHACANGKSKEEPYKPKSEGHNQENLYLYTWIFVIRPMRVYMCYLEDSTSSSLSNDYSHDLQWVKFLGSCQNTSSFNAVPVPPLRTEWDMLFQPLFDELLNPPPSVDHPAPEVVALIDKVAALEPDVPTGSPSFIYGFPYGCNYMRQALFCTTMLSFILTVEPKTHTDALTQACWIEAMQEELNEFERLKVWELVPRPYKVMVITLKWIYKVKQDELGGILKEQARLSGSLVTVRGREFNLKSLLSFPVVRLEAIRSILAFAAHMNMVVYQMDVKTMRIMLVVMIHDRSTIGSMQFWEIDYSWSSKRQKSIAISSQKMYICFCSAVCSYPLDEIKLISDYGLGFQHHFNVL